MIVEALLTGCCMGVREAMVVTPKNIAGNAIGFVMLPQVKIVGGSLCEGGETP